MNSEELTSLQNTFGPLSLAEGLQYAVQLFGNQVVFSSSFGQEDQVIFDAIARQTLPIRVFTLDTGRLFQQTYELIDKTRTLYKQEIEVYFPESQHIEQMVRTKGLNSFYQSVENRKECCAIRKVQPLKRALQGAKLWITGLRAEQSENRAALSVIEWDANNQVIKYNPLIHWNYQQVIDYLKQYNVPDNPLHYEGFVSIGCQPCTRAIAPGQHPRAGRWWWEEESKKECGLHK